MRVHESSPAEVVAGAQRSSLGAAAAAGDTPRSSFAKALARSAASETGGTAVGKVGRATRAKVHDRDALPKGPKGETTREVPNHPYLEVMSGPRNGMFINTTNNERRGEAFVLVRRKDRDLHIYGHGKNRRVIISWHKDQPAHRDDKQVAPAKDATHAEPASGGTSVPA